MKYGRLVSGEKWHMLRDGRLLCGVPGTPTAETHRDQVPDDGVCQNCDGKLREMGKAKRPPRKWKKPDPTTYRPKHRERFE